ncbi:hypothetical protein, conserved [Leishmania tarentolae]|uniref:Uncharacterized protein n=1 Tax=Leishmania tarentolae TaxID=5689 RepID=A0A640KLE7_LEITA|nr:hypothetical protein, conserved [Leishmania tarentolae]
MYDPADDDGVATEAQHCVLRETSEEGIARSPSLVAALTAGTEMGDWRMQSLRVADAVAADNSTSACMLVSPRNFLAHQVLARQYFTAPGRALPGEGIFSCSPDLDSDRNDGLHRRGGESFSWCSSDDHSERCEDDTRKKACWAAQDNVSRQSVAPAPASACVDTSVKQAGLIDNTPAAHVPFTSTLPLSELTDPSLASPHLPGVNATATVRQAVTWRGSVGAVSTPLPPPPLPPQALVIPAQVVWQAEDTMLDNDLLAHTAALTLPPSPHLPTTATRGASQFASDGWGAVLAATAEKISTTPTSSLHAEVRTQTHACRPLSSVISNAERGHSHAASPWDGRYRWMSSLPAQGAHASGGWEVEEEEEWDDNIFDEDGTLRGVELCLWLPRRAARCCFAAVLWLRRFLGRRGICMMFCPLLASASASDDSDSGSDTANSSENEEAGQRGATRGAPRLLGRWSARTAHVCQPLLSGFPTTHWGRQQLQTPSMAHSLCFTRADDPGSTTSEEEGNTYDAASPSLSFLPMPFLQLPPDVTAGAENRGLGEAVGSDLRLREAAFADSMVGSPSCFSLFCSKISASLRRCSSTCYRALSRTAAYYNVFTSQCTSEMHAYETQAPGTVNRHAMSGSSAPSPPPAEHATAAMVSSTPPPSLPTDSHSRTQSLLLDIAFIGQVYVLLQYVALVLLTATVVWLAVFSLKRSHVTRVEDATACNRYSFTNVIPPDMSFSLVCFPLNGVFAVRYAVRAVRYEKGGLLVVQAVVSALQVFRAAYFLFFVARRCMRESSDALSSPFPHPLWPPLRTDTRGSVTGIFQSGVNASGSNVMLVDDEGAPTAGSFLQPIFALTWANIVVSVSLFVVASMLSPWVYAGFGWRRYAQGIVQVSLSRVRQRLTVLRTCVQLDGVITANAYLATVFLLDNWPDQRLLLLMTLSTFAVHYFLIPMLRRSRHWWPLLCAAAVLVTVSAYYAAVIGGALRKDHRLQSVSSSPWYSDCYTERLRTCLYEISAEYPVSVFRDASAAHSDGGLNLSYNRLERDWQQSLPVAAPSHASALGAVQGALWRHSSRGARMSPGPTTPSFALAAPSRSAPPVQRVNNATDTYLPTYGAYSDYFRVQGCNATCFLVCEESDNLFFERHIASCCADYGQCRLKDDYRTYAVLLLLILMVFSSVVRAVLLAVAWRRWVEEDDVVIELFVQEHCRRRHRGGNRRRRRHLRQDHGHRHRRAVAGDSDPLSQSPQRPHASNDATFSASPPQRPMSSPQPTLSLPWNVDQYFARRLQQCTADSPM